mmetsp:Transcript_5373/g.6788  ORF Transcript_5373/g.6788 Transcript_5373/m.6788 type:complete len:143 (-) Transcript_5373:596-1024(-)|eukprot:CAMPEP_0204846236 /NCGR_PEP_ID=MMETSP1347-20130617/1831_1 /ASSEMBLY_ACC=CAM_ASM_000690 /TAXON_ID=215587 /ORGANISM="Aplanochytrium stocchinoi, Strain GSBS06" /LENGTH=142 /DNA_ID=CAMNT_0051986711 /DNA_START=182 /DNA_END=610 /DNA_ORIENTATION=+
MFAVRQTTKVLLSRNAAQVASGPSARSSRKVIQQFTPLQKRTFSGMSFWEKSWRDRGEIIPLVAIVSFALGFGTYELFWVTPHNPEVHFSKPERKTMDYVDNERSSEKAENYAKGIMHKGPKLERQWRPEGDAELAKQEAAK